MSIIPGIENLAPLRTDTSSGSAASPSFLPIAFSSFATCFPISPSRPAGQPPSMYARHASVEMVNPGGTGRPKTEVISARLAPLPPSRSFRLMGGFRCLWSKAKTYVTSPSLPTPCPSGSGAAGMAPVRSPGEASGQVPPRVHPTILGASTVVRQRQVHREPSPGRRHDLEHAAPIAVDNKVRTLLVPPRQLRPDHPRRPVAPVDLGDQRLEASLGRHDLVTVGQGTATATATVNAMRARGLRVRRTRRGRRCVGRCNWR